MSADLERMGDLARHVAQAARRRFPDSAVPAQLRATILEMGQVAERLVAKTGSVIATHDVEAAWSSSATTTRWTTCTARCSPQLLDSSAPYGVEAAIDVTLVGRYYERFADHAVSVARRVVYLVTGQHPSELAESA